VLLRRASSEGNDTAKADSGSEFADVARIGKCPESLGFERYETAEPNALLTFSEPVAITLPGGLRRAVRMLALFVDTPDAFSAAIQNLTE